MTEEKQAKANEMSLEKAVKLVVEGVKTSHQITETAFTERLIKPYKLEGKAVDQLVQEFEDNGISIVDDKGEPSKLALAKQKNVEKAELEHLSAPGSRMNDPVRQYLKRIGRVSLLSGDEEVQLAKRIESGENESSFRRQHSDRFREELLRCGREVETVWQNDQIEGFVRKGERFR